MSERSPAERQIHRLFFALRPDGSVAMQIEQARLAATNASLFRGHGIAATQHHVTLHFLGDYDVLPIDVVERANMAAGRARFAPFQFTLDRVSSFRGERPPCVLLVAPGDEENLKAFRHSLRAALLAVALGEHLERRFTPHLTLAYGDQPVAEPLQVEPIVWPVRDFCLVESLVGKSVHKVLGSWALTS
jgi:RNA 2',3'-cyclic 3'-phosphodiesterase